MKDSFPPAEFDPKALYESESQVPLARHGGMPALGGRRIRSLSLGCNKTLFK